MSDCASNKFYQFTRKSLIPTDTSYISSYYLYSPISYSKYISKLDKNIWNKNKNTSQQYDLIPFSLRLTTCQDLIKNIQIISVSPLVPEDFRPISDFISPNIFINNNQQRLICIVCRKCDPLVLLPSFEVNPFCSGLVFIIDVFFFWAQTKPRIYTFKYTHWSCRIYVTKERNGKPEM